MLRPRADAPPIDGEWANARRLEHAPRARTCEPMTREEELYWLRASEYEIRMEMERRLEDYFRRKRRRALEHDRLARRAAG